MHLWLDYEWRPFRTVWSGRRQPVLLPNMGFENGIITFQCSCDSATFEWQGMHTELKLRVL